jgi:hypothetical protein
MSIKRMIFIAMIFCLLCLVGCGYQHGVVQSSPKSYLWFTGNIDNAVVYIDDLEPFKLTGSYIVENENGEEERHEKGVVHYEVSPGKHKIVVVKNNRKVVERIVLLGDGITKEIEVP